MMGRPSIGTLLLLSIFCAVVLRAGNVLGLDADYVLHCAYGRAILAAGSPWLREDPTIYTAAGVAPILHEWGAEALFAILAAAYGHWGPLRVAALLAALVPWLLFRRALRGTSSFWPALLAWVASASGIATGVLVRPHLFSVAGFWLTYQLLERWRDSGDRRVLGWLALVVVFWTNLHGGGAVFLLALLLGIFAAGNRRTPGAWAVPLLYGLTLVNPWGPRLHLHLWRFLNSAAPHAAADMGPPSFRSGTMFVMLALALLLGVGLLRGFRPVNPTRLAVAAATFVSSCLSMRSLPYLGISLGFLLPEILEQWLREKHTSQRSQALAAAESTSPVAGWVMVAIALLPLGPLLPEPKVTGPLVPEGAITWLREHPETARQRGYAGYDDSGFLLNAAVVDRLYLHSLNANTPVPLATDEAILARGDPAWQALFAAHGVAWAMIKGEDPLAPRLSGAGWRLAWSSDDRLIYLRP